MVSSKCDVFVWCRVIPDNSKRVSAEEDADPAVMVAITAAQASFTTPKLRISEDPAPVLLLLLLIRAAADCAMLRRPLYTA